MIQLASRRALLCFAAAALAAPARAADGPAAQLIETTAAEVIQLIKTTTGAPREAGIEGCGIFADEADVVHGGGFPSSWPGWSRPCTSFG